MLIAFLQQILTYGGFYDNLEWVGLEAVQIVGSMSSSGGGTGLGSQQKSGSPASIRKGSSKTINTAENFLLKVRINSLKNKIGFRGLSMEERAELEDRI